MKKAQPTTITVKDSMDDYNELRDFLGDSLISTEFTGRLLGSVTFKDGFGNDITVKPANCITKKGGKCYRIDAYGDIISSTSMNASNMATDSIYAESTSTNDQLSVTSYTTFTQLVDEFKVFCQVGSNFFNQEQKCFELDIPLDYLLMLINILDSYKIDYKFERSLKNPKSAHLCFTFEKKD